MKKTIRTIKFRRKREMKTDYKKRRHLLLNNAPRLVMRKSSSNMKIQLVQYQPEGDKVLVTASSLELKKHGWKAHTGNTPAAYLTGILLAKKAKEKKIAVAIPDFGLQPVIKGSRLFAALKGCQDGGMKVTIGEGAVPSDERMNGAHIASYTSSPNKNQFTRYKKNNADPTKMTAYVDELKKKLLA